MRSEAVPMVFCAGVLDPGEIGLRLRRAAKTEQIALRVRPIRLLAGAAGLYPSGAVILVSGVVELSKLDAGRLDGNPIVVFDSPINLLGHPAIEALDYAPGDPWRLQKTETPNVGAVLRAVRFGLADPASASAAVVAAVSPPETPVDKLHAVISSVTSKSGAMLRLLTSITHMAEAHQRGEIRTALSDYLTGTDTANRLRARVSTATKDLPGNAASVNDFMAAVAMNGPTYRTALDSKSPQVARRRAIRDLGMSKFELEFLLRMVHKDGSAAHRPKRKA